MKNKRFLTMLCLLLLLTGLLSPLGAAKPDSALAASLDQTVEAKAADDDDEEEEDTYTYDKTVAYSKIKSKLKKKSNMFLKFEDSGSVSALTFYGFFYKSWPISGYGYGVDQQSDVIILYPIVRAVPQGSSSKLSVGIKFRCNTQVISLTARKFTKMTLSGGGKKVVISGSTKSKNKPMGQFVRNRIITTGIFTMSRNTAPHPARLNKIKKILESGKVKILFRESTHNKTYKCSIADESAESLLKIIENYENLLINYRRKVKR